MGETENAFDLFDYIKFLIFGPEIHRIHSHEEDKVYIENDYEAWATTGLRFRYVFTFFKWTLPIWIYNALQHGVRNNVYWVGGASVLIYFASLALRGYGRYSNCVYRKFADSYNKVKNKKDEELIEVLSKYDFSPQDIMPAVYTATGSIDVTDGPRIEEISLFNPKELLAYLAVHSFGKRLLYPGSTSVFNLMIQPALIEGRAILIEKHNAIRRKICTANGLDIDTCYVKNDSKRPLVVCCEGNAGFYEVGITNTSIAAGFPTLGWNHPGFGQSTGFPTPRNEVYAIDAVMKYAIEELGYEEKNIIIYAWSIGAFTGSWAAKRFPGIKGVVLDATFDEVLPLALTRFHPILHSTATVAVRKFLNLNNSAVINDYHGPLVLFRRLRDEIIVTGEPGHFHTNRANDLLHKILSYRFPDLFDEEGCNILTEWLHAEKNRRICMTCEESLIDADVLHRVIHGDENCTFPMYSIHEKVSAEQSKDTVTLKRSCIISLAELHLKNIDISHCEALDPQLFVEAQVWLDAIKS